MSVRDHVGVVATTIAGLALGVALTGTGATYALFSDSASVEVHVGAGVWDDPEPPARPTDCDSEAPQGWGVQADEDADEDCPSDEAEPEPQARPEERPREQREETSERAWGAADAG